MKKFPPDILRFTLYRLFVTCFLLHIPVLLNASSFKIVGTRPLGMGGAFVAVAEDSLAAYWNPAVLGIQKGFDLQIPASINIEATGGVLHDAKKVADSAKAVEEILTAQKEGKSIDLQQLKTFANTLNSFKNLAEPGKGFLAETNAGCKMRISNWAFSIYNFSSVGVDPYIDLTNLSLGSGTISGAPAFKTFSYNSIENLQGIDLSKLPNINISTSPPNSQALQNSSVELSSTIQLLAEKLGVSLGDYTPLQISNALINLALNEGNISETEIINAIKQIKDAEPIILNIFSANPFRKNESNLTVNAVSVWEIVASNGFKLVEDLYAGVNLKFMIGNLAYMRQEILKGETIETDDLSSLLSKNLESSTNFGVDVGLLYKRDDWILKPRFGLLARNINSPTFKRPQKAIESGLGEKYTLEPQWRAGVAIRPFNWWLIASDVDVTKNKTEVDGYYSQNISVGNEFNIFNRPWLNLALRTGYIKNTAYKGSPSAYTAGLGLNLLHFVFELAGAISTDTVEFESGRKLPSRVMVSMTVSLNF